MSEVSGTQRTFRTVTQLVRERPDMFFEGGVATGERFLADVLQDVRDTTPDADVRVFQRGDIYAVSASQDWLVDDKAPFADLFGYLIPKGQVRANAHRAEYMLVICAQGVLATGRAPRFERGLSEADIPGDIRDEIVTAERSLVWRFNQAKWLQWVAEGKVASS